MTPSKIAILAHLRDQQIPLVTASAFLGVSYDLGLIKHVIRPHADGRP